MNHSQQFALGNTVSTSDNTEGSANTIRLMTNEANLYKNMRLIFADSTKVLAEIMQNARRAGAKKVQFSMTPDSRTLVVEDDGIGIDNFQNLLHNSVSGWDQKTVSSESAFGIGFLSTLYAADQILIESRGQKCHLDVEKVIALEPVVVTSCDYIGQTRMTFYNFKLSFEQVKKSLETYARGFSISVILNDNELIRPHALDNLDDIQDIDIGQVHLCNPDLHYTSFYYQGLPIKNPFKNAGKAFSMQDNVVHLNNTFELKMPDRHALYDEEIHEPKIRKSLANAFIQKLKDLKAKSSHEEFVKHYKALYAFDQLALLNDVPLIPCEVVFSFQEYPTLVQHVTVASKVEKPITQASIANGEVKLFCGLDTDDVSAYGGNSMILQTLIHENDWLFMEHGLDEGHWVYQSNAINLDKASIKVIAEPIATSKFFGECTFCDANIVDEIKVIINATEWVLSDPAVASHENGYEGDAIVYLGKDANPEVALTQACAYQGEFEYLESDLTTDTNALTNLRSQLLGELPEDSVKKAIFEYSLNSAPNCDLSATVVSICDKEVKCASLESFLSEFVAAHQLNVSAEDIASYIKDTVMDKESFGS